MNIYLIILVFLPLVVLGLGRTVRGKTKYAAVFLLCSGLVWLLIFMIVEENYYLDLKAGNHPSSDEKNLTLGLIIYGGWIFAILYSAVVGLLLKFGFHTLERLRKKS